MPQKVLDVGQCDIDNWQISQMLTRNFDVVVERVLTHGDAVSALQRDDYDLVLVNRILDGDGTEGIELLKRIKSEPGTADVPVMMVSNYADAQTDAEAAGAVPGFGKNGLNTPETIACLQNALGATKSRQQGL